jgi:hypothetical protein
VTETAPEWFAITQAGLCLGAAWAIFAMYLRGPPVRAGDGPSPADAARDPGLLWLAAAVGLWGVAGGLHLPAFGLGDRHPVWPLLSSANSTCLLISAAYLDYGIGFLQRARAWPRWRQLVLVGALAVAIVTVAMYAALGADARLAKLPDLVLAWATLLIFGFGLFRSFLQRGFLPLAILACVAVALQTLAQLPEVTDALGALAITGDRRWALVLVSKALTLVAFLSLGMSWVHEVARRPSQRTPSLVFTGEHLGKHGKRRYVVRLGETRLEMRETPHRDLLALAIRRVRDDDPVDGGWIALPDLVGRLDDSRIRRVREDLRQAGLDAAVESNFQKCFRLAIPPDRIAFERAALGAEPEYASLLHSLDGR